MKIILNGEHRILSKPCNLSEALEEWGYQGNMPFAVAINHVFIPRQNYDNTLLAEENKIEIVMPMQGG